MANEDGPAFKFVKKKHFTFCLNTPCQEKRFNFRHKKHQSGVKQLKLRAAKAKTIPGRSFCSTQIHYTRPHISQTAAIWHLGHTPSHSVTLFLVSSEVSSVCLNLVWAPVFTQRSIDSSWKQGWSMSYCVIPQRALRQNSQRAPRAKPADIQKQCDASVIVPDFPSGLEDLSPSHRVVHFPPDLIPSPAMNCQPLSQPRPHINQSLVYFTHEARPV